MIRLTKASEPTHLANNKTDWLNNLNTEMAGGLTVNNAPSGKKYNHPTVKAALMSESHSKCIYCESKMKHVDHGEIEHIKPKSLFPQDIFDWNNLGFVCSVCNNTKSDKHDTSIPIVNPFVDDPSAFLVSIGAVMYSKPGSDRGQFTIQTVDLNRTELVERRNDRIKQLHTLLEKANRLPAVLKQAVVDEVNSYVSDTEEFSATAKAVLAILT